MGRDRAGEVGCQVHQPLPVSFDRDEIRMADHGTVWGSIFHVQPINTPGYIPVYREGNTCRSLVGNGGHDWASGFLEFMGRDGGYDRIKSSVVDFPDIPAPGKGGDRVLFPDGSPHLPDGFFEGIDDTVEPPVEISQAFPGHTAVRPDGDPANEPCSRDLISPFPELALEQGLEK